MFWQGEVGTSCTGPEAGARLNPTRVFGGSLCFCSATHQSNSDLIM